MNAEPNGIEPLSYTGDLGPETPKELHNEFDLVVGPVRFRKDERKKKEKDKEQTAVERLMDALEGSGIHGIKRVIHAHNWRKRALWFLFIVALQVVTILHTTVTVMKALEDPKKTTINEKAIQGIEYPPITLCPNENYGLDVLKLQEENSTISYEEADQLLYAAPFWGPPLRKTIQGSRDFNEYTIYTFEPNETIYNNVVFKFGGVLNALEYLFQNMSVMPKVTSAGSFSTFNVEIPLLQALQQFPDDDEDFLAKKLSWVIYPGDGGGVEQAPFFSTYLPLPAQTFSVIKYKSSHIEELESDDCSSDGINQLTYFEDYTFDNCMWEKEFMKSRIQSRKCTWAVMNLISKKSNRKNVPHCDLEEIRNNIRNHSLWQWVTKLGISDNNPCIPLCERWAYEVADFVSVHSPTSYSTNIALKFTKPTYTQIEEEPAMEWPDYLSLIGGNMGLWLGASLVSYIYVFGAVGQFAYRQTYENR